MSNKDISRYLTKENGSTFSNDTELLNLATNSKIKNKNSGIAFKKVDGAVFDKLPIEVETTAVLYTAQTLTNSQKQQARENIGVDELDGVPLGTIVMWSGKANTIPDGWQVCDGSNGTPNLVGRFVIGRSSAYPLNTYGGSTDHFHYFGWHNGDNYGRFYLNGDIHGSEPYKNTAKNVKAPSKAAIISSLEYNDSAPNYEDSEIKAKSAMWNGDNGGGISDQNFHRGNMITSLGYGVSADDTLKNCLPPYWSLYYIMKVRGTGSASNGGTAASASQVERLSDLISQLQARITTLENSSSSGGSGSGSGFTFGNVETKSIGLSYITTSGNQATQLQLPGKIKAGTIVQASAFTDFPVVGQTYNIEAATLKLGTYIVVEDSTIIEEHTTSGSTGTTKFETHSVKVRKITGVNV